MPLLLPVEKQREQVMVNNTKVVTLRRKARPSLPVQLENLRRKKSGLWRRMFQNPNSFNKAIY